jgi:hypothetical protein
LSHQLPADTEDEVVGFVVATVDDVILGKVVVTVAVVVVIWFVAVVDVDVVQEPKNIDASMRQVNAIQIVFFFIHTSSIIWKPFSVDHRYQIVRILEFR